MLAPRSHAMTIDRLLLDIVWHPLAQFTYSQLCEDTFGLFVNDGIIRGSTLS